VINNCDQLAIGNDVGHGQLEGPLDATRHAHGQPSRCARRQRRNDDLVEVPHQEHVGDGGKGPLVTHLAFDIRADQAESLEHLFETPVRNGPGLALGPDQSVWRMRRGRDYHVKSASTLSHTHGDLSLEVVAGEGSICDDHETTHCPLLSDLR
jgi:hypothetical protein